MTDKKSNDSRRKLLKSIAAGSGAVVAGKTLPEAWTKPVIDTVMLPAHAETTDATLNYFGSFLWNQKTPIQLCIQCVGSDCSAKTLEDERFYYEGNGSLNADMVLRDPTDCESYLVELKVETVNGVATGQFALGDGGDKPISFSIPMAACGFSADDNKCGEEQEAKSENRH